MQKNRKSQSSTLGKSRLERLADLLGEFLATAWLHQCKKDPLIGPTVDNTPEDVSKTQPLQTKTKRD